MREMLPRVASVANGDSGTSSDAALVVLVEGQNVPPFEGDVVGQRVEALGAGGPVVTVSPSCGLGGTASVNGPFGLGNAGFAFTLNGADGPNANPCQALPCPGCCCPRNRPGGCPTDLRTMALKALGL